jgi:hypothetical protein
MEQLRIAIAETKRLAMLLHTLETRDPIVELQKALTQWYGATGVHAAVGDPDETVH